MANGISHNVQQRTFQGKDHGLELVLAKGTAFGVVKNLNAFYDITVSNDKKFVKVEPINGNPRIYVAGGTNLVWESERGSGTGRHRARVLCQIEFDKMNLPSRCAMASAQDCSPSP